MKAIEIARFNSYCLDTLITIHVCAVQETEAVCQPNDLSCIDPVGRSGYVECWSGIRR